MPEAIIPALVSGAFVIISTLLSNRLIEDPLQRAKDRLEVADSLTSEREGDPLRRQAELYARWALKYGDAFRVTRRLILFSSALLFLFIIAGYTAMFAIFASNAHANLPSIQTEEISRLVLETVLQALRFLLLPCFVGLIGFSFTGVARHFQIKRIERHRAPFPTERTNRRS